jgi:predicted dehydrogenase
MIRVGIIGAGFGKLVLQPAFTNIASSKILGIVEGRKWQEFLNTNTLDAVAIAVPPDAQYEIAKYALKKGLHVFAEKPLAPTANQAIELLSLAKKNRVIHGIDFMFPEIDVWRKAKMLLDKKTFGKVENVSVNWVWQSDDLKMGRTSWKNEIARGGGALSFYFSHGLHYLEHFVGKISSADAKFEHRTKIQGETGFDLHLVFKNGVRGRVHVSCMSGGPIEHSIVFECEHGVIELSTKNAIVDGFSLRTFSKGKTRIIRTSKSRRKGDERTKIVRILARRFITACRGLGHMSPTFEDGARVQELVEMIRASSPT